MKLPVVPLIALFVLSGIWGYSWVFLKLGAYDAGPFWFAGLRTFIGSQVLLLALPLTGRAMLPTRIGELVLLGLVNTTALVGFSQWSLVEGGAARTSVLVYTMPFWTLLIAWPVLNERIRGLQWPAIALALAGLVVIVQPWSLGGHLASNGLALAAAVCWSASAIMTKRLLAREPMDLLRMTAWQMFFGSVVLLVLALMADDVGVVWSERFISSLLITSVVSTALGWLLWVYLLDYLSAGVASMTMLIVPVIAVASAAWQLGETLALSDLTGIVLILIGLGMLSAAALRQHREMTGLSAPE